MIGREWKEMPKEKQQVTVSFAFWESNVFEMGQIYAERAKKDKERYTKEMEAYNQKKAREQSHDDSPVMEGFVIESGL